MGGKKRKRRPTRAEKIAAAKAEGRGGKPPPSKYAQKKADQMAESLDQNEGGTRES